VLVRRDEDVVSLKGRISLAAANRLPFACNGPNEYA